MAHAVVHVATSVGLVFVSPYAAVGALLPDVGWVRNESRVRKALPTPPLETIAQLTDAQVRVYRVFHSLLLWAGVAVSALWVPAVGYLALGVLVHVVLDLPTHDGRMQQRPIYPFKWRWPWILPKYKQ